MDVIAGLPKPGYPQSRELKLDSGFEVAGALNFLEVLFYLSV